MPRAIGELARATGAVLVGTKEQDGSIVGPWQRGSVKIKSEME